MLKNTMVGEVAHPFKANSQAKSTPEQSGAGAFVPFESKGVFSPAPAPKGPFITDEELRARYGDDAELLIDALDRKVETQKAANHLRDREAVEAAIARDELRRGNEAAKRAAEERGYDLHPKIKTARGL